MSKFGKNSWKYGLIKISTEYEGTELEEQINHLVELYPDENENYTSFCDARIMSIEELESALNDIKSDGINEYFFNNGKFNYKICTDCYKSELDWEPSHKTLGTAVVKESRDSDPYIKLTSDLLLQMGWSDGDDIEFDRNYDGTFTLTKVQRNSNAHDNDDADAELYAVYGGD